eukprot:SAG11_NODE_6432_length_1314_cov_2.776132_1_plen_377_part_10
MMTPWQRRLTVIRLQGAGGAPAAARTNRRLVQEVKDGGHVVDTELLPADAPKAHFFLASCRLRSGKVLLTCRRGKDKMGSDANTVLLESGTGGAGPWAIICEGFERTFGGVRGEVRGSAVAELQDGRLLAVFTWHDASDGRAAYSPTTPSVWFRCYSANGGSDWTGYTRFDLSHPETGEPMRRPVLAGGIIALGGGRLAVCGESLEVEVAGPEGFGRVRDGHAVQKAFVVISLDDGRTFGQPLTCARDPRDETYYWDQRVCTVPTLLAAANAAGTPPQQPDLLHAFWTHDAGTGVDKPIHLARGFVAAGDSGECEFRWEEPFSTGLVGQIAQPLVLTDGRVCLWFVRRTPPFSMVLALSGDGGRTFRTEHQVAVYDH